ncbi:MAG TPA: carboxypeptidase-like regulatory domain-containing protein [Terracidiphilus sp.]|nr:carboxypeptidase-like regulatory domain-containing protein [Terracidiphilus sp.]
MAARAFKLSGRGGALKACFLFALLFALMPATRLSAQTAGTVSGHVADSTGAVMPNATILLKNLGTGTLRTTLTTGSGDYTFTEVPPATYRIQVSRQGFKTAASGDVELHVQQSLRQDFTLEVGEVTQSVTVTGTGELLQVENASLGTVVENQAINQLPLNGRNYLSLVALSANANTLSPISGQANSRMGGDRASQAISVGGQRIMFDYYTLDGVNNTDPDFNTYVGLPSLDGIQEFKVQTGVYPAEFGHEATQVNVVSKSGTNTFHGSMYDFMRNNIADANLYYFPYNATPPKVYPYKWNDYGFELDGPIYVPKIYNGRDKFFFMVDDEWRKIRSVSQGNATVPSPAIASGDFSGFTNAAGTPVTIYDPATGDANGLGRTPFPNNKIDPGRISPQSAALLKYLGTSTKPFYANGKVVSNYAYGTMAPQNRQSLTVRGDYTLSQRSQFAFRYSSGDEDITSTGLLGAGSKIITNYSQYMGSNTWIFSPTIVNEARFGYSHFFNSLGLLSAYTNNVVDAIGIPGLKGGAPSTWGIPDLAFSQGPQGTTPAIWQEIGDIGGDGPYVVTDPTWQIVDNLSWVKGKHSMRFGFEYNRQTFNQLGNQFSRGQFFAQPISTALQTKITNSDGTTTVKLSGGDSLADALLGDLSQATVAVAVANANYVRNVQAYYVDDTYKILPRLTISAGLRYELTPPWNDTYGKNFNAYVPHLPKMGDTSTTYPQSEWPVMVRQGSCTPANVYQGLSIRWTSTFGPAPRCSNGLLPNGPLMDTKYLNFAPRFSISYSPDSVTVIRAGYGIFYMQDIGNAYFDMERNIAGRATAINVDTTTGIYGNSNLSWANAAPGASGGTIVTLGPGTVEYANAPSHKTSYTEQFLLNIQRQVGQDWSFEAGYQGALSRHLYGFINANQPTPYGYFGGSATSVASRLPFSVGLGPDGKTPVQYGLQYVHDQGTGNYNALSVKATRRFSKGFNVISSYTWGKSLDDTSGIRNQGNDNLYPQNSLCISCEYGRSAFDVKNRIVISALYELPMGPGKLLPVNNRGLNAVVGGWQVGGIFTHQTGAVGTPLLGRDNSSIASPFGGFDRPNLTGTSPYLKGSARTLNSWVNKAAYATPTAGTFGSMQRGSFTGPGYTNLDASLHKEFAMPYNEKHLLAIRFEAFNSLNHPNWNNPNLNLSSSTFGRITTTAPLRQLQLAAKYEF